MKRIIFWNIILCIPLKVNWRFGGKFCLHFHYRILFRLFFNPEDGVDTFLEMTDDFQQATQHYIPEDSTLQIIPVLNILIHHFKYVLIRPVHFHLLIRKLFRL